MSTLTDKYTNPTEAAKATKAVDTIVQNLTLDNLVFIAELSGKTRINEKIQKQKMFLKAAL